MNLDLAPHIHTLLYQQDTVIFPDFGGLVGSYKPASIDYVQGLIYPPSKILALNERLTTSDGVLEHFVRNKFELTGAEAREVIRNFVQKMKDDLDQGEIVLFPKVGRLYKNYERKIQFLQESTNFNKEAYGLPSLQFYPILRSAEEKQFSDAPTPVSEPKMVGRSNQINRWMRSAMPILIGCAVVSIAISLYFISPVGNDGIAGDFQKLPVLETRLNQRPDTEQAGIGDHFNDQRNPGQGNTIIDEDVYVSEDEEEIDEDVYEESEAPTYAPNIKECVIIIGAFGKKSGVRATVEKVYDLGYDAYQDRKNNLTRVGIQFAYEEESDVDRALAKVRKQINRKAWILTK